MLVTFSVVDTSSVFVFNRKLTFAKDDLTLNEFFISKNVSVNTIVEIKVGSSMNSLCSVELSCISDILTSNNSIPRTCVFYNSWKKNVFIHSWSNNQLSCGILRKIFTMRVGDYKWIINYDWPNVFTTPFNWLFGKIQFFENYWCEFHFCRREIDCTAFASALFCWYEVTWVWKID